MGARVGGCQRDGRGSHDRPASIQAMVDRRCRGAASGRVLRNAPRVGRFRGALRPRLRTPAKAPDGPTGHRGLRACRDYGHDVLRRPMPLPGGGCIAARGNGLVRGVGRRAGPSDARQLLLGIAKPREAETAASAMRQQRQASATATLPMLRCSHRTRDPGANAHCSPSGA
jgi:hypothetical protein